MKISYTWLSDYISLPASAEEIVKRLTFAGMEVGSLEQTPRGDIVFEIEITANRPDWLSLQGIAREISALTGAGIKPIKTLAEPKVTKKLPFSIEIEDRKACPRYIGRLLRNVKVSASPSKMAERLTSAGSRLINNAADITNFCLFETGQPMHAFDFDKLKGGAIIVRRARDKEEIVLIDNTKRVLDPSILVIADAENAVAIAGIMGGKDTEVTGQTKNVLLESAFFDPVTIRRSCRKLGLRTDASYRFERRVDPDTVLTASRRAAWLYKDICSADVTLPCQDVNYLKSEQRTVNVDPQRVSALIGTDITPAHMKRLLTGLGFNVTAEKKKLAVRVPGFRNDVRRFEDIVEEVARIYGYEKIPECLPSLKAQVSPAYSPLYQAKQALRRSLTSIGMDEVITYSLLGEAVLAACKAAGDDLVKLMNPLSAEQACLRTTMVASLLKVINVNQSRQNNDIKIFEIGKTYHKEGNAFAEHEVLAIALCGNRFSNWQDHQRSMDFYDSKGAAEYVLEQFGITNAEFARQSYPWFNSDQSVRIYSQDITLGHCGLIKTEILKYFDIPSPVYFCQLDIETLTRLSRQDFSYQPLSRYPSVTRDIAMVVKEMVTAGQAEQLINEAAGELCVNVRLFDVYSGNQVPQGHKSLAFSVEYQSRETTLTEEQVSSIHAKVIEAVKGKLGAVIR